MKRALPFRGIIFLGVAPAVSLLYLIKDDASFLEGVLSRGQTFGRDFSIFWGAAVMLWRGQAADLFDPFAFSATLNQIMGIDLTMMPFPYPPHSLLFVAPLAFLNYPLAFVVWLSTTFSLALALLWRNLQPSWPILVGLLLCPATIVNISTGQNGFLSAAFLCGGLLLLERRPLVAGLLIGLLSYKPHLGLLIPLLLIAGGHWRAFAVASVTVIAMVGLSVLLFGTDIWLLFLTKSGPLQLTVAQYLVGQFQLMSPTYLMSCRLLGMELWQAWTLQGISTILATCAAIWAFRQDVPHALKSAVAMVAIFLVSPYVLTYDLMIVAIAILVASLYFTPTWWERTILAMAWLLPGLVLPASVPIAPLILTALFIALLRRVAMIRNGSSSENVAELREEIRAA